MFRARCNVVLGAFVVVVASCGASPADRAPGAPTPGARTVVSVVEVTDGDTIRVNLRGTERPVRLIGIDTPEEDGPYTGEECFGEEASRFTTGALAGRAIELELDVELTDRFDRTLAYVWLEDELFNERLVLEGYAVVATFPPNVRYVERFRAAEHLARNRSAGLWAACRLD